MDGSGHLVPRVRVAGVRVSAVRGPPGLDVRARGPADRPGPGKADLEELQRKF